MGACASDGTEGSCHGGKTSSYWRAVLLAGHVVSSTEGWQLGERCRAGKTSLVRLAAALAGQPLVELALSAGTDTADLLGGFEQLEPLRRVQVDPDVLLDVAPWRCLSCPG